MDLLLEFMWWVESTPERQLEVDAAVKWSELMRRETGHRENGAPHEEGVQESPSPEGQELSPCRISESHNHLQPCARDPYARLSSLPR